MDDNLEEIIKEELKDLPLEMTEGDQAFDGLEPYWTSDIEGILEVIKGQVTPSQYKSFEACQRQYKALWYIKKNVEKYDTRYGAAIQRALELSDFTRFQESPDPTLYEYYYHPFLENLEFESLLRTAKACLDIFSFAIGIQFGETPANLDGLEKVLTSNHGEDSKAQQVLKNLMLVDRQLRGIVLDPGRKGKKSIRDLCTHYESANIRFTIYKDKDGKHTCSRCAMIEMFHPKLTPLPNLFVPKICNDVWYYIRKLLVSTFRDLFGEPTGSPRH